MHNESILVCLNDSHNKHVSALSAEMVLSLGYQYGVVVNEHVRPDFVEKRDTYWVEISVASADLNARIQECLKKNAVQFEWFTDFEACQWLRHGRFGLSARCGGRTIAEIFGNGGWTVVYNDAPHGNAKNRTRSESKTRRCRLYRIGRNIFPGEDFFTEVWDFE